MNNRYYNTIGTGGGTPGGGIGGGGIGIGGGGVSTPTLPGNFTSNPNNYNGLIPGPVAGTGTGCGCDYTMNCWSQQSPSNLQAYTGLNSATCPTNTQGTTAPPTTYNGTCYNTTCPVTPNTITNASTTACPANQQHSAPTCVSTACYKCQGANAVGCVGGYNGNCPSGCTTSMPNCGIIRNFDGGTQYNEFVGDERYMNAEGAGKQRVCDQCEGAGAICKKASDCPEGCKCNPANTGMSDISAQRRFTGQENGDYLYSNWDFNGGFNPTEDY